jgi:hypothetical protein
MNHPIPSSLRRIFFAAALTGLAVVTSGCVATVRTHAAYQVDTGVLVYDDYPDYEFATYPRYLYGDGYVYLVGDRWYSEVDGRWAYYREEPPVLLEYRRDYYVQQGYREPPRYGAPPSHRGRYEAPSWNQHRAGYGSQPRHPAPAPTKPNRTGDRRSSRHG